MPHYWKPELDDIIDKYNKEKNTDKRNELYVEYIHPALEKLVENIIFTFKFKWVDSYINLKSEMIFMIYDKLYKYEKSKGYSYSYFGTAVKNNLMQLKKKQNRIDLVDFSESNDDAEMDWLQNKFYHDDLNLTDEQAHKMYHIKKAIQNLKLEQSSLQYLTDAAQKERKIFFRKAKKVLLNILNKETIDLSQKHERYNYSRLSDLYTHIRKQIKESKHIVWFFEIIREQLEKSLLQITPTPKMKLLNSQIKQKNINIETNALKYRIKSAQNTLIKYNKYLNSAVKKSTKDKTKRQIKDSKRKIKSLKNQLENLTQI